MNRHRDWRKRLSEVLNGNARTGYKPGEFDCALFAADVIEAMTGIDIAQPFRGGYDNLDDGKRLLKRFGYADLAAFAVDYLDPIDKARATTGDIAIIKNDDTPGWNCGVVNGERIVCLRQEGGLGTVPRGWATIVFRV